MTARDRPDPAREGGTRSPADSAKSVTSALRMDRGSPTR